MHPGCCAGDRGRTGEPGRAALLGYKAAACLPRSTLRGSGPRDRLPRESAAREIGSLGCPQFRRDTVLDRPEEAAQSAAAITPGLHRPRAGSHSVVWWDPQALELNREPEGGLRRESLLVESESKEIDDGIARAHEAWHERWAATTASGSARTFRLMAPTGRASSGAAPEKDVSPLVEVVADRDASRPRGKRFGTLLHAT